MTPYEARFGGTRLLVGPEGQEKLRQAHVCVVGVGGVGSWVVEALARCGIGQLTMVDFDDVCVSNVNRQLHALDGELSNPKVEVTARRARAINPDIQVHALHSFFIPSTAEKILATRFDYVVDAIDSAGPKALLVASCQQKGLPVLAVGGAAGRHDPTRLRVNDLAEISGDRLLLWTRKNLRWYHAYPPAGKPMNVECVWSTEVIKYPPKTEVPCPVKEEAGKARFGCGNGMGTFGFLTGTFGLVAAAHVVSRLTGGPGLVEKKRS
jgi:tRNA A37 threonylcarbamoyladenosine dehydratase